MKKNIHVIIFTVLAVLTGCEIKQKEYDPKGEFIKIFNHSDPERKYFPAGIAQLDEGGYLVVTEVKYEDDFDELPYTDVFKTTATGELEWTKEFRDLRFPAKGVINTPQFSGFVAMSGDYNGYLVTIDLGDGSESNRYELGIKYPLAIAQNDHNMAVLGYNSDDRTSQFNVYNIVNIDLEHSSAVNINNDVVETIREHLNKLGDQLPFFIGEWTDGNTPAFFVNCYENYTIRLILFDRHHEELKDFFLYQDKSVVSSFIHKGEDKIALTFFSNNDNYIITDTTYSEKTSEQININVAMPLPELSRKAKVFANKHFDGNDSAMVFISSTNKNSIQVYQYGYSGDKPVRQFDIGFDEDIEIANAIQTDDMGYAVLARIFVAGKYARPVVLKIPPHKFRE